MEGKWGVGKRLEVLDRDVDSRLDFADIYLSTPKDLRGGLG